MKMALEKDWTMIISMSFIPLRFIKTCRKDVGSHAYWDINSTFPLN